MLDVTVVIPTYNRAGLIRRALDSVQRQRQVRPAVIVIDDASTDSTPEVVRHWAIESGIPVVIDVLAKNSGAATARNRGINLAKTPLIAFLDSDDEFLPYALDRLIAPLLYHPNAVLSFANAAVVDQNMHKLRSIFPPHGALIEQSAPLDEPLSRYRRLLSPKDSLLRASMIPTCATCFRREAAIAAGGMPTEILAGEDWLFWLRLAQQGEFIFQPDELSLNHVHADNLTHPRRAVFIAKEKLRGFTGLLDGSLGISLTHRQHQETFDLQQHQVSVLKYLLSKMGVSDYLTELRYVSEITKQSIARHVLAHPKFFASAIFQSARQCLLSKRFLP